MIFKDILWLVKLILFKGKNVNVTIALFPFVTVPLSGDIFK